MAECFDALCTEASNVGTRVGLEIIPFSNVRDIPTAMAIVGAAGARNGGLLLDIWHITRAGIDYRELTRIPKECIISVELCDASQSQVGSLLEDTLHRRKLCGEGDFNIPDFIRAVLATGYNGPFGVEIISEEQRLRPLDEAAKLSFASAMNQFAALTETVCS